LKASLECTHAAQQAPLGARGILAADYQRGSTGSTNAALHSAASLLSLSQ
jgi:hypothetical protein